MKAPTRAAWERALKTFEKEAFNALLREDLDVEDRIAVFRVHALLRERASGVVRDERAG